MTRLLVEIDARTTKAERDLEQLTERLNELERAERSAGRAAKDAGGNFGGLGDIVGEVDLSVMALKASAVAAVGAIVAMTHAIADNAQENANAAKIAGMTAKEFKDIAFAASMYGLEADAVGDIFKDVKEKIGDFLTTGGGGMQDFADALAMSAEDARKFAKEMIGLSAQDVIQKMVGDMEKHGASIEQISFALEGMGSDLTKLIPLFVNGGAEGKRLADALNQVSSPIREEDSITFAKFNEQSKLMGESWKSLSEQAFAPVAKWLGEIYEKSAKIFASFNSNSIIGNKTDIENATITLQKYTKQIEVYQKRVDGYTGPKEGWLSNTYKADVATLENAKKKVEEYKKKLDELEQKRKALNGEIPQEKKKAGTTADSEGADVARKAAAAELKELQKLYMTKRELAEAEEKATLLELKTRLEKGDLKQWQYDKGVILAAKKKAEAIGAIDKKETSSKEKEVDIRAQLAEREKEILIAAVSSEEQRSIDRYNKSLDSLNGNLEAERILLLKHESEKAEIRARGAEQRAEAIDYEIEKERAFFEEMQANTFYSALFTEEKHTEYIDNLTALFEQKNEILAEQTALELEALDLEMQAMLAAFTGTEEQRAQIVDQFNRRRIDAENKYKDAVKANAKTIAGLDKKLAEDRSKELQKFTSTAMNLNSAFFDDNKGVKAGLVVIDTAAGIMNAYASMDPYSATFAAAGILATGMSQLQAIKSASKDGGGSVGSSSSTTPPPEMPDTKEAPTMAVGVTDASGFSAASNEIRVSFDEDNDLGEFLNKVIKKAQIAGR